MAKNELMIVESIGKRLQERRPENQNVFPLTPTHRKELRDLKYKNIGDLRNQLRTIKSMKQKEYCEKYSKELGKNIVKYQKEATKLNQEWTTMAKTIRDMLKAHKEKENLFEEKAKNIKIQRDGNYDDNISRLNIYENSTRSIILDEKRVGEELSKEEFDEKFAEAFKAVDERIDDLNTKYEEAINFGDLELVKELYYLMKSSDSLFKQIREMKV